MKSAIYFIVIALMAFFVVNNNNRPEVVEEKLKIAQEAKIEAVIEAEEFVDEQTQLIIDNVEDVEKEAIKYTQRQSQKIESIAQNIEKNNAYITHKQRVLPKALMMLHSHNGKYAVIVKDGKVVFRGSIESFYDSGTYKTSGVFTLKIYNSKPESDKEKPECEHDIKL